MNNKELSKHYKLGYKIGFNVALIFLKKYCDDDESLIDKLIADYNKHPVIEKIDNITVKELLYAKTE